MQLHKTLLLPFILLGAACSEQSDTPNTTSQQSLDSIAETLDVEYRIVQNRSDGKCAEQATQGPCFLVRLSLTAKDAIPTNDWAIYFSSVELVDHVVSGEFDIKHINGDLNRITPKADYQPFAASETKAIEFVARSLSLNESRAMPNYFITAEGLQARTIASTQATTDPETGLEVLPHSAGIDLVNDFIRADDDFTPVATSSQLFANNSDITLDKADLDLAIIPTPTKTIRNSSGGTLDLASGIQLSTQDIAEADLSFALAQLQQMGVAQTADGVAVSVTRTEDNNAPSGSYSLNIADNGIAISAADGAGAAYALTSLAALLMPGETQVPLATINDAPRYEFRGVHVDVSRNFHSKAMILRLLDQMAAYKMNKLHLHLADDEGWRLEIDGLPELTDVGSRRGYDAADKDYLLPQLGTGANPHAIRDGYYSKADYIEILQAASARHIQVIPSLDMPGHSRAAVKAMESRYHHYMANGDQQKAEQYLLTDLQDKTVYQSIQFYSDNTLNVCMESTYDFIAKVLNEVQALHNQANHPMTRYHIGADETAGAWLQSPACEQFIAANNMTMEQLGSYFIERVANSLHDKGIEPAAWSDGLSHTNAANMPAFLQSNLWTSLPGGAHKDASKQLHNGWSVVLSLPDSLYFDFPYEFDAEEGGYYWGSRHSNTRKVFEFMPDNLPIHAEFWKDAQDRPFEADDRPQDGHKPLTKGMAYEGIQVQLWSETVRSDEKAEYHLYPRLMAVAERAWHNAAWEVPYNYEGALYNQDSGVFTSELRQQRDQQWNRFANTIGHKVLPRLDSAGVFYRIPTVGAKVENGQLQVNSIFPGLNIEYRENGGHWQPYNGAVEVQGDVDVRAMSTDGKRKGRMLRVQ